jgi:hypothetical protein
MIARITGGVFLRVLLARFRATVFIMVLLRAIFMIEGYFRGS